MIPLWLKISYTLFVVVLVPVWWLEYGPANFLWASDIALLVTVVALWRESRLLASMMAVAARLPSARLARDHGTELAGAAGFLICAPIARATSTVVSSLGVAPQSGEAGDRVTGQKRLERREETD